MSSIASDIGRAETLALSVLEDEGPALPQALIVRMRERDPGVSESLAVHALWRLNNARRIYLNAQGRLLPNKNAVAV